MNLERTINEHIKHCYPEIFYLDDPIKREKLINQISKNIETVFEEFFTQKFKNNDTTIV